MKINVCSYFIQHIYSGYVTEIFGARGKSNEVHEPHRYFGDAVLCPPPTRLLRPGTSAPLTQLRHCIFSGSTVTRIKPAAQHSSV